MEFIGQKGKKRKQRLSAEQESWQHRLPAFQIESHVPPGRRRGQASLHCKQSELPKVPPQCTLLPVHRPVGVSPGTPLYLVVTISFISVKFNTYACTHTHTFICKCFFPWKLVFKHLLAYPLSAHYCLYSQLKTDSHRLASWYGLGFKTILCF